MAAETNELTRKLIERIDGLTQANEKLVEALTKILPSLGSRERRQSDSAASPKLPPMSPAVNARRNTPFSTIEPDLEGLRRGNPGSVFTGESDESEDDESYFVLGSLPEERYTEADLRDHLQKYGWENYGRLILGDLPRDQRTLNRRRLFDNDIRTKAEVNHMEYHHSNFYEVGADGAPLPTHPDKEESAEFIWHCLNNTNADTSKQRKAVGSIAILREPSALLLGAVHMTMNKHFHMDEIFRLLTDDTHSKAYMKGSLKADPRQQRSFVFSFKYYCIVGEGREPLPWQKGDEDLKMTTDHIPIATCSAIVALSFTGDSATTLRRKSRKTNTIVGHVFDPFSPWKVLSIQCYSDWRSTVDVHEQKNHYVNGPEAFLITLLAEYRDACKRFMEINKKIVTLVTPPPRFMFDEALRDILLFEDDKFTYSRRYFWAFQTLGVMNDSIEAMIAAYKETFTDEVWKGDHKLIWPGNKESSPRFANFRRRLTSIRSQFEQTIKQLEEVLLLNKNEQRDIKSLREQLFSGTSVVESREAVAMAKTTVQQGFNIKLLTLVSIFFLPLTFVTSVFGMTNMDSKMGFVPFGIVTTVICLPTYFLIGSLNSHRGMKMMQRKTEALFKRIFSLLAHFIDMFKRNSNLAGRLRSFMADPPPEDHLPHHRRQARTLSMYEGPAPRSRQASFQSRHTSSPPPPLTYQRPSFPMPHIQANGNVNGYIPKNRNLIHFDERPIEQRISHHHHHQVQGPTPGDDIAMTDIDSDTEPEETVPHHQQSTAAAAAASPETQTRRKSVYGSLKARLGRGGGAGAGSGGDENSTTNANSSSNNRSGGGTQPPNSTMFPV